jgi:hypothetical protein
MKRCEYDDCGKPLVQKPHEKLNKFNRRRFCDARCSLLKTNYERTGTMAPTEPHACRNPACGKMMYRAYGEAVDRFYERKYCSRACTNVMLQGVHSRIERTRMESRRYREGRKDSRNLWQQQTYAHFKNSEPRTVLHPEIKTVEQFMQQVGVTKCPTAYVAVVQGATPLRRDACE